MMNEINKLIWPNTSGIGIMNAADYSRTASIAKQFGVIKKAPSSGAYRTDLAAAGRRRPEGAEARRLRQELQAAPITAKIVQVTAGRT